MELIPCPFCGATQDELCGVEFGRILDKSRYYVQCVKCSLVMTQDREDKVIGMWNNRANKLEKP